MQSVRVTQLISDSWATTLSSGSDGALHIPSALWKWLAYVWVSWRQRSRVGCNSFLIKMKYHVLHPLPTSCFLWFRFGFSFCLQQASVPWEVTLRSIFQKQGGTDFFLIPDAETGPKHPLSYVIITGPLWCRSYYPYLNGWGNRDPSDSVASFCLLWPRVST